MSKTKQDILEEIEREKQEVIKGWLEEIDKVIESGQFKVNGRIIVRLEYWHVDSSFQREAVKELFKKMNERDFIVERNIFSDQLWQLILS